MTNFGYIPVYALRFMIAYFIVTNAAAMILFPGGTLFNPDLNSYSFSGNFFSDLGITFTRDGTQNFLSSFLFNSSLLIMGLCAVSHVFVPNLFRETKKTYVISVIASILLVISGISFIGVGLTPADIYFEEHVWFVILAFNAQTVGIFFMTIAFLLSKISNRYTIVAFIYFINVALYTIFETSEPPPDFNPFELENVEDVIDYNRFTISVVWQKIITVISMISILIFTFGYKKLLND